MTKKESEHIEDVLEEDLEEHFSEEDSPEESASSQDDKLTTAQVEAAEQREKALRMAAEMENLRRRSSREMEQARKFANERVMRDLLQVVDSLDRGLEAAQADGATVASLHEGMELTAKLLLKTLADHGLEEVDPLGEKFDPEVHEAVSTQPSEEYATDHVMAVLQKGYRLNGRLVRPAMVIVAQ